MQEIIDNEEDETQVNDKTQPLFDPSLRELSKPLTNSIMVGPGSDDDTRDSDEIPEEDMCKNNTPPLNISSELSAQILENLLE